ncbi:MAG: ABC transporter ATP-binding protein [Candidatus Promineifilaceae bacterium]|nr:ABC transporter ATP-binding protein [Candidatus Promineifilaceae bacterium]
MLQIEGLNAGYGDVLILRDVSLAVEEGQIVALIGANGAGKTTTLRAVSGLIPVRAGAVHFDDEPIQNWPAHRIVAAGLVQVPEERHLFGRMTVQENLELGSIRRGKSRRKRTLAEVYDLFPRLAERQSQAAGTLSGGEQQMLAVARALMTRPKLLMLDEPSLGLAPLIVADIFRIVRDIRETGTTILIVEQNAQQTLAMADYGYVMENGEIVLEGSGEELLDEEKVRDAYLGL